MRRRDLPVNAGKECLRRRPTSEPAQLFNAEIGAVVAREYGEHARQRVTRDAAGHLRCGRAHVSRDQRLARVLTLVGEEIVRVVANEGPTNRKRTLHDLRGARGPGSALEVGGGRQTFIAKRGEESRCGAVGAGPRHGRDLPPALPPLANVVHRRVDLKLAHGLQRDRGGTTVGLAGT